MTIPALRPWAFLAAILVGVGLALAIAVSLIIHGPSFTLGTALGVVLWFLHDLITPTH